MRNGLIELPRRTVEQGVSLLYSVGYLYPVVQVPNPSDIIFYSSSYTALSLTLAPALMHTRIKRLCHKRFLSFVSCFANVSVEKRQRELSCEFTGVCHKEVGRKLIFVGGKGLSSGSTVGLSVGSGEGAGLICVIFL